MRRKTSWSLIAVALLFVFGMGSTMAAPYDFQGQTVTFGGLGGGVGLEFEEGPGYAHLLDVQERFNVVIEFNPIGHDDIVPTVSSSVLAGEVPADVITVMFHQMEPMAAQGLLYPLDEATDEAYWNSLPWPHSDLRDLHILSGTTYAFSSNHNFYGLNGLVWNIDMFDREGLPSIYELQEAGEWTWDAMLEIAQALTQDTTGDGEINQWGIQGIWNSIWWIIPAWTLYSNNAAPAMEIDGQVTFTYDRPEAIAVLELWHDLQHVHGVVPPPELGNGVDMFAAGNLGMCFGDRYIMHIANDVGMEDNYGFAYFPQGPHADRNVTSLEPYDMWVIPVLTEHDPAMLIELTNALFELSEDYYPDNIEYWAENEVLDAYAPVLRDRASWDVIVDMMGNFEPIRFYMGAFGYGPLNDAIAAATSGSQSAAAAMESVREAAQAHYDDILGQ